MFNQQTNLNARDIRACWRSNRHNASATTGTSRRSCRRFRRTRSYESQEVTTPLATLDESLLAQQAMATQVRETEEHEVLPTRQG